ncbi:MAG: hypothetical protein MI923_09835 [Phycisphaerales bacterium]|nr:hypothetical protein [Phycisphaerales bacterium]
MDDAKQLAMQVFSACGCCVKEILESSDKRADLLAADDDSTYIVEVKHKLDDSELFRDHAKRMTRGEIVSRSELLAQNNRIGAILKHARDQLDNTPGPPDAFRLIWFHADGVDHDLHWKRAFATFYGTVHLLPTNPPQNTVIECFYFDYSAAVSLQSVNAMILSNKQTVQLCLNEFSDNVERFCDTALFQQFAKMNGVVDPRESAAKGDILVCRSPIPRKNDDDVLNALRKQTGILYTVVRLSRHHASAMVGPENPT